MYQVNRIGWPFLPLPIKDMITRYGATAYVATAQDSDTKWAMGHYQILEETPRYVIIDLTKLKEK